MEIKDILVSVGVVIICSLAIFTWVDSLQDYYGVELYSSELTQSRNRLLYNENSVLSLYNQTSTAMQNGTEIPSGSGEGTQQDILSTQSSGIFTRALAILGFVPGLLESSSAIVGLDGQIVLIAIDIFKIVVAITFAYIIFLGVKSLFGR